MHSNGAEKVFESYEKRKRDGGVAIYGVVLRQNINAKNIYRDLTLTSSMFVMLMKRVKTCNCGLLLGEDVS